MRVLLSGYYGFGNAGDEALLEGLAGGLERAGYDPVVLSADPGATRRLHQLPAVSRTAGALPALLRCDAFVSGGGGLLQDRTSARSLRYYLSLLRAARLLGKKTVVYGQSIGPLSAAGERRVGSVLAGLPVAVRDRQSQALLARLGIESELVGDPALLLDPPRKAAASDDGYLLLIPRAGEDRLNEALAGMGARLSALGWNVAVLALHPEEDRQDGVLIASEAGAVLLEATDHRAALERIGEARLVASGRLHGLILAAVAGRPALGLVYDPKVAGFLDESGGVGLQPPFRSELLVEAALQATCLPAAALRQLRRAAEDGIDWLDARLSGLRG